MFVVNENALQEHVGVGSRRYRLSAKEKQRQRNRARYMTEEDRAKTYASLKNWAHTNPERYAEIRQMAQVRFRLRRFGLTPEQFEEMLRAQDFKCAVCRADKVGNKRSGKGAKPRLDTPWPTTAQDGDFTWHIDHDHLTGKVRGLLCHHCNAALGHVKDDPAILAALIKYLAR
jgi:hypothetical protein